MRKFRNNGLWREMLNRAKGVTRKLEAELVKQERILSNKDGKQ